MRIRWTPTAFEDLKSISAHIEAQSSIATANRVCRVIYDAIQLLARFPDSGRTGIEEATRELVVAKMPTYVVTYRVLRSEAVEILRIWHGAQRRE